MQTSFEKAKSALRDFIEQRRNLALLARCADADVGFLTKLLGDLDDERASTLFIIKGGQFSDAATYVQKIIGELEAECSALSVAAAKAGKPSFPPFPEGIRKPDVPAPERLRRAVAFSHELLPDEGDRLVWAIVPDAISDESQYLQMLAGLLPRQGVIEPWMRRLRLVLRDQRSVKQDEHPWARAHMARLQIDDFEFTAKLSSAIDEQMNDESLPMDVRINALLCNAMIDGAHGRVDRATDNFNYLLGYFQQTNNVTMQAMVMSSMGDMEKINNPASPDKAQYWYECALEAAADCKNPIVVATIIKNLGGLALKAKSYSLAEEYFVGLDKVATKMLDVDTKSWAIEQRGICQAKTGRLKDAIQSWETGAKLCRNTDTLHGLRPHLEHLREAYPAAGQRDRVRAIEEELKAIPPSGNHHAT